MPYYDDLSRYEYSGGDEGLLNVGWLGHGHWFPTGSISEAHRNALIQLAEHPAALMRGLHYCEFCDVESPIRLISDVVSTGRVVLGNGEIRVQRRGVSYAAPTLIIHYIDAHAYLPPADFLDAALFASERAKG